MEEISPSFVQTRQSGGIAADSAKRRSRSIARRINGRYWLDKLGIFLVLDLAIAAVTLFLYLTSALGWTIRRAGLPELSLVPASEEIPGVAMPAFDPVSAELTAGGFLFTDRSGAAALLPYDGWARSALPILSVVCLLEAVNLFFSLFHARRVRHRLRPLDRIAMQAEAISQVPLDTTKFDSLEQAILQASPEAGDLSIQTGDRDLEPIENALNSLLLRIQESHRQQVRFVSDASHELRTPIAVIQGYADLLARWGKDDEAILQESISSIQNESRYMKELVEQLLFLARGDSGRSTLQKESLDLGELIREVWEESGMIDGSHEYLLSETTGAWMTGDAAMLKQSVRILVQNAAKYSPAGRAVHLGVTADIARGTVSYYVEDEGIGMDGSDLSHIFERFYRTDEARSSATGGSGLGLSIAKWIVDAHDGEISVTSVPEVGTRFTVSFPM